MRREDVEEVVGQLVAVAPPAEYRLVGTASSLLRGAELPDADVDVLFRERSAVDAWFAAVAESRDVVVDTAPTWLRDDLQYFARVSVGDVSVELSTVEVDLDVDTAECVGEGPWRWFDLVRAARPRCRRSRPSCGCSPSSPADARTAPKRSSRSSGRRRSGSTST